MQPKKPQPSPHTARLRALPRVFIEDAQMEGEIELPADELIKLRKVLRLSAGSQIAILPNNGSLLLCTFGGRTATAIEQFWPESEAEVHLTIAQALPKGDKLDEIVRACTELGAAKFLIFPSDRSVVQWDDKKVEDKIRRLNAIARESAEQSYRTRLPQIEWVKSLREVLEKEPKAVVLSEAEGLQRRLPTIPRRGTIVVGPEGGWSPPEMQLIGERGITLGPRVLRVEHAAPAAAAILLLDTE